MNTGNRNLLLGTIIGLAVGGATAILLAPAEGKEIRRRLRRATDQARDKARDTAAKGRELIKSKQSQLQEAVEEGRKAAGRKREELEKEIHART